MKKIFSLTVFVALLCGCGNQNQDATRDKRPSSEMIEGQMAQFAVSNNAVAITDGPTNWLGLTVDVESAFKRDGKPVVVEVVLPDVRRDESGGFLLEGQVTAHAPMMRVRVEVLISTNMIPKIRAARSELSGLWVVMTVESVQSRPIENDEQEYLLRGKATTIESRPSGEWMERIAVPDNKK